MKITYTGTYEDLAPKQRSKFETKLQKLSKMLERKGEREAHVILSNQRHLNKVEITLNAFDHALVGVGSDGDLVTAMSGALEKLEKQVIRMREKWRDTKRSKDKEAIASETAPAATPAPAKVAKPKHKAAPATARVPRVFPVDDQDGRKPMTLEEAMVEMDASRNYLVFRDAQSDRLTVLLRRPDGNFDLIES